MEDTAKKQRKADPDAVRLTGDAVRWMRQNGRFEIDLDLTRIRPTDDGRSLYDITLHVLTAMRELQAQFAAQKAFGGKSADELRALLVKRKAEAEALEAALSKGLL